MKHFFPGLLFLLFAAALPAQTRYYVRAAATGAGNGKSWADAFTDLQNALKAAKAGDEIWVAQGTYKPTATADRAVSFEPKSGVQLYGGFAGAETALAQRDWDKYPAVLSGDIGAPGDSSDNAYTVMYLDQPDSNTVVDGFTLRDGAASYAGADAQALDRRKSGGGLYIMGYDGDAYAAIRNCRIEHNAAAFAGGGVLINGGGDGSIAPTFWNCTLADNSAGYDGGGMARYGASWVERPGDLDSCVFLRNFAGRNGGGLYCFDGERKDDFDFSRLHFLNNWALGFGGGAMVRIGRIDGSSILELSNCDFTRNASRVRNGALLIDTRQLLYTKSVLIKKCHFIENDTLPTMQVTFGEANAVIGISLLGLDNSGSILLSDCNIRKNRTKNNSYIVNIDFYDIKMLQVEKSVFAENFYVSVQKVRVNPGLL